MDIIGDVMAVALAISGASAIALGTLLFGAVGGNGYGDGNNSRFDARGRKTRDDRSSRHFGASSMGRIEPRRDYLRAE